MNVLKRMVGDDRDRYTRALESARQAIRARIRLWDGPLRHSLSGGKARLKR